MSSIWSNAVTATGGSPFATTGKAPSPGGGSAARFQSVLESAGKAGGSSQSIQSGMNSAAATGLTAADATAGTNDASDSGATISANDFLTLLVTEMQNQDPTAQTDPNEYINQLVQINSLEQLISINQNLSDVLGAATSPVTPTGSAIKTGQVNDGTVLPAGTPAKVLGGKPSSPIVHGNPGTVRDGTNASPPSKTAGNLSLPLPSAASRTVAHSLDGHGHAVRTGRAIRDIPVGSMAR